MAKRERTYSIYVKEAAVLLGKHIQLARKSRRMSAQDCADRLGITRSTLQKIENGNLKCEIGIAMEAASLVGVSLFDVEPGRSLAADLDRVKDKLSLVPSRIRATKNRVDDAF